MWFKNRRAKFRKKQRSLQKEQLQKQKDASPEASDKSDPPSTVNLENPLPPSSTSSSSSIEAEGPSELSVELNVTSAEQSGSESATEDNATDREEELKIHQDDIKVDKSGSLSPPCKHLSPKPGKGNNIFPQIAIISCNYTVISFILHINTLYSLE